jgi:epoxyqueuosine reductase
MARPDPDPSRGRTPVDLLASEVRRAGLRAGLAAVGTCSARPFDAARAELERRRALGLHGGMAFTYRNPARSTDPTATLPTARSLVVGAWRYPSVPVEPAGAPEAAGPAGAGRVARYATGDHYGALRRALAAVAERLRADGWRAVVLADDNALVDRAAARRAGIGWCGKSSNVLLPGRGSWFVLGGVLTDADLGPDPEPVADGCGTCERCLDGCPTGAIVAPGVVDARRCLSWLLQDTGSFPEEHRAALGDRIYGCDDCQEVCPPNRRADRSHPVTAPADGAGRVDLAWMLTADDDELLDRLGRWYVPRRDPRYLRRNALVVLGNVADGSDPAVVGLLERYLHGADELLAEHARWAAESLGRHDLLAATPST